MSLEKEGAELGDTGLDTLATLTRSPVRLRILEIILERGSSRASDVVPQIDASRRTVSRSLAALEEQQLVNSDGQTYQPTTFAKIVADDIFELLTRLERGQDLGRFLDAFPTEEFDLTHSRIADGDGIVTCRHSSDPHAPVSHVIDTLSGAQQVRILAPIASPVYIRTLLSLIRDGASVEAIVDAAAYDSFCGKLRGGVRLASTLADVSLYVHDDVQFGLVESDECVVLGAYDDGVLQASFETADERIIEATRDVYTKHRTQSDLVVK